MFRSKTGWLFVLGHGLLFATSLWQRGGPIYHFHAVYEPWLLNLLVVADLVWVLLAGILLPTGPLDPAWWLIPVGAFASIQWYWIGSVLEGRANRRRLR
ncbi:MAG TPA: hypothetical protein VFZ49_03900 [Pyrinomonadaceae bacterium]